jgi:hypothetical protein
MTNTELMLLIARRLASNQREAYDEIPPRGDDHGGRPVPRMGEGMRFHSAQEAYDYEARAFLRELSRAGLAVVPRKATVHMTYAAAVATVDPPACEFEAVRVPAESYREIDDIWCAMVAAGDLLRGGEL